MKIAHNRIVTANCARNQRELAPSVDRVEKPRPSIGERFVAVPCRAHPCLVAVDQCVQRAPPSMCHARWPVAVLRADTARARHHLPLYCRVVLRGLIARGLP